MHQGNKILISTETIFMQNKIKSCLLILFEGSWFTTKKYIDYNKNRSSGQWWLKPEVHQRRLSHPSNRKLSDHGEWFIYYGLRITIDSHLFANSPATNVVRFPFNVDAFFLERVPALKWDIIKSVTIECCGKCNAPVRSVERARAPRDITTINRFDFP